MGLELIFVQIALALDFVLKLVQGHCLLELIQLQGGSVFIIKKVALLHMLALTLTLSLVLVLGRVRVLAGADTLGTPFVCLYHFGAFIHEY